MHMKREKAPKNWPVKRKGTAYVVRPSSNSEKGIPVLIILRDMLKIAKNRKEVKKAIHDKNILVNNRLVKDDAQNVLLFDTLAILPSGKYYRMNLSKKGKFDLNEIKKEEINYKIAKVSDRKMLKGKKIQLNLSDGRNFLSDIKCNISDSVLINLKEKKIERCIPLKEKSGVIVYSGKHSGAEAVINKLDKEKKMAEIIIEEKKVNVLIKQLMAVK